MLGAAALALLGASFADPDDLERVLAAVRGDAFRAHVAFLADDLLEGRDTGSRGYDLAALYVASQLQAMGLEPAGAKGSWLQPVPLRQTRLLEGEVALEPKGGPSIKLKPLEDYLQFGDPVRTESRVTAPVVFAGFGVTAPEMAYDDYAGLDARGKIVVVLFNAPPRFPSEPRAHFASIRLKAANAVRHGAVGIIGVRTTDDEKRVPWERVADEDPRSVHWLRPDGTPEGDEPELRGSLLLSPTGARRLFASSPVPLEKVFEQAAQSRAKGFPLPVTATIASRSEHSPMTSANVVGRLEGSDPVLKNTYVVYSAHLDHVGLGRPVNGDRTYNGAYDNASGVAVLLEAARALAALRVRPARSVLFVFVTGEEKGLVGSDYFAQNPTVPGDQLVANVNVDMPLLLYPLADIIAFGADNSSLLDVVTQAASRVGLTQSPDPMPAENLFIRSDQYSFVRRGVPSVFLVPGFRSSDPAVDGGQVFQQFLQNDYHRPSDDLTRPMDLPSAERFIRANVLVGYAVASDPEPPRWKPGNFFGKTFGRP
jgi:Peptidase family M28/PA domain